MSPPGNLDDLSPAELKALVIRLMGDITELQRVIEDQRAEIARLKGLKGRPRLNPSKPSGMEEASLSKPLHMRRRGRGHQTRVAIEEEMIPVAVPAGSRFKGYQDYVVQELEIRPRVLRYRRERWLTPDGCTVVAPLPAGICGHFGPNLRRFVLAQCHQGQVTVPRLVAQLRDFGLAVSKRQLVRLLTARQEPFLVEARDVLRAGLTSAAWLAVDDTGARHKAQNGFCTQIGNDRFAWFGTTASKSRRNFLELLRAGYDDYVINAEALAYMRSRNLAGPVIQRLAAHPDQHFADHAAWQAHLDRLGITALTVTPDPVLIATEGALWGSVKATASCLRPSWSATMPASSRSAATPCVGSMPNAWSTSSTPSPTGSVSRSNTCARGSGGSTATSRPTAAIRHHSAEPPCAPVSSASSSATPALLPSIGCSPVSMPTKPSC